MDSPQELDRFSRPNEKEVEIARCFCLSRDGYICNICKTPIQQLIMKDKLIRELMRKPPRKRPIIVLNHKDGTMNFHIKNVLFGNVEMVCIPCNRKYKPAEVDYDPEEIRTYSARKSHQAFKKWVQLVNNYITKFGHGCEERLVNKYSKVIKCSQDILKKYDKREYETRYDLFEISDLNIECDYRFCSGVHICFWGERPEVKLTDQQAQEEEDQESL